jgi:inner membrane protein
MPSIVSHPAIPLALTPLLPDELRSPSIIVLGVACSVLPDLDVVGFRFGVPYGHMLGHRGLSHSIVFALLLSACLAWLFPILVQTPPTSHRRLVLFGFLCLSTLSHGLLDALTSGGLGVAFFAPLDNRRYFFPWRPIRVSPITVGGFFSVRGVQVLHSELQWVWLPAALVTILTIWLRRMG